MSKALTVIAQNIGVSEEEIEEVLRGMIISAKNQHGAVATKTDMVLATGLCSRYDLNPLIKEVAFFVSGGKLQAVIPIDGWIKILNRDPNYDGVEFNYVFKPDGSINAIEAVISMKNRSKPVKVMEFMDECIAMGGPTWKKCPARMLRNKALGQCVRVACGVTDVIDSDEAARITGSRQEKDITPQQPFIDWQAINDQMAECADLDTLKGVAGSLRREMEINGTWAQHKDHIILLHAEHKERIEKAYSQPAEAAGEVVDAEFTESVDIDFGDSE